MEARDVGDIDSGSRGVGGGVGKTLDCFERMRYVRRSFESVRGPFRYESMSSENAFNSRDVGQEIRRTILGIRTILDILIGILNCPRHRGMRVIAATPINTREREEDGDDLTQSECLHNHSFQLWRPIEDAGVVEWPRQLIRVLVPGDGWELQAQDEGTLYESICPTSSKAVRELTYHSPHSLAMANSTMPQCLPFGVRSESVGALAPKHRKMFQGRLLLRT